MTPQEVIKKFMTELNANNYTYDTSGVGTAILDDAVRSSSKFASAQSVIDAMKADQVTAEKLAVEEILGSEYAGQTISQISSTILSAQALTYNTDYQYSGTVQDAITTRKASIFLEQFCGIQLNTNYAVINSTVCNYGNSGNVDTGAITGSDANITLTAGDVVNGTTLTAANLNTLATKYGSAASLSGNTLVIGTGVEKDEDSIVPEEGDMYLFTASGLAKNIDTGSNGWVVNATTGNDTITSGGRDSINAGTGNDKITANADEATITTGAGSDTVEISAAVKSVTITDLNSSDTIKISGTFEVGNARIENSMLVVTDKTGTRKIKFSDLTNVGNAKIGAQKISDWLGNSGFSLDDLSSGDTSSGDVVIDDSDAGRVAIDPDYTPNVDFANQDSADQTQTISSTTNINLGDVTISSGTVKSDNSTVGTVESVSPAVMNFTTRGLTVHVGDGTATSYNALTSAQKMMVAALFKWWAGESLELNEDSYGISFEDDTAKVTDITLSFENLGGNILALVSSQYRGGDGQVNQLQLKINTAYYNTFDPTNKNGVSSSSGAGYLDRTLAHEFTHAVMSTNINNFSYLPQFIKEGTAELTHGIDDERGYEIFALAYNSSSLSSALSLSDTSTGTSIAYSGGYMFMRYFAKQAALQTLSDDFAPGDITATVNLGTGNATYYVSGNSTLETATTSKQNISLGSASGSTYTVGTTGVNQMINTGSTAKNIVGVNHKTSVMGGADNDTIQFVEGTFINAAGGKNSIVGSGQFATITAGTGNDTVLVKGSSNSIALGDGNNLAAISSEYTYNNTITTGAGDDTVTLDASYNATIQTGAGNDSIKFGGANNTIDAGDGADTVNFTYGNDSLNVVNLGDGDDSATLLGYQNSLLGGDGKDTIFISGSNNTLELGAGDDSIYEYTNSEGGNYFLYNADSGNDTIWNFQSTDKLVIAGDYATEKTVTYSGGQYIDVRVSLKSDDSVTGTILLKQALSSFSSLNNIVTTVEATEENPLLISLTAGNDSYSNSVEGATIRALDGNDSITNGYYTAATGYVGYSSVSIDAGAGNDTIYNRGSHLVTIDGGTGKDGIYNYYSDSVIVDGGIGDDSLENQFGNNVTINAGEGNDSIWNHKGSSLTFNGGDGNDTIYTKESTNVTINGGTGNDRISFGSDAKNNLIEYADGDGNDTVTGFDATSTLQIGDGTGTYSTQQSGDDIIVTVGEGSVKLVGAASLASVNISGTDETPAEENPLRITLTAGNDSYSNSVAGATIQALAGNDTITNTGASVSINSGNDDDKIFNYGGQYVTINGGNGADYIENTSRYVTIDGGAGNDNIFNNGGADSSIVGGDGNDSIINVTYDVSIDAGAGNDYIYNHANDASITDNNISIAGGDGSDTIENHANNVTISGGTGNDRISLGTNVINNLIEYTSGDGADTIWGFNATSTLKIGDGTGTYSTQQSGDDIIVTVGEGSIKLVGAATLSAVNISGTDETPGEETSLLVTLTEGNDSYSNTVAGATIQALGGDDSIVNEYSAASVSIDAGAGADSIDNIASDVTISAGDDADIIQNYSDTASIDGGNGNDTILNVTGYYNTLSGGAGNDSIINRGITVSEDADGLPAGFYVGNYLTLSGGAGNDTIWNEGGNNISIDAGDGADDIYNVGDKVSIDAGTSNDYIANVGATVSINAGAGNDTIENGGANVSISAGTGSDQISLDGSAENNLIQYTSGDGADTVWGFNATSTLKIGNGTGTYSTTSSGNDIIVTVGEGSVKLVGAATLASVNINGTDATPADPAEDEFYWTFTNGTATYVKTNGTSTETLFTISGLNPDLSVDDLDSAIEISGNQIILSADVLAQRNITLTTNGSYALKLDEDCPTVTATEKGWTLDGTTATYHDAGKSDGYKLTNSKTVTYTPAVVGKALLTVSGVVEGVSEEDLSDNITVSGKTLTVTPDVVSDKISISSGYKIVFAAGDYDGSKFTGTSAKDTIEVKGTGLIVDAGAGNDTVTSNGDGGNIYLFASANGKDTITGYGDDDTIKITDGSAVSASVSGKNIIVTVGNGSMTLKDAAANGTHVLILDSDGETLIDENFYSNRIVDGNSVTLTSAFKDKTFTTNESITAVDASATTNKFTLTGSAEDETLIGGKGANFINGNGGENILTGGKGNDTFVAGGGGDTISDYGNGTDKISLAADITDFSIVDGDIILNFDDDKSLTIAGGYGKKINFIKNGKSSTEIFTTEGILNSANTAITLAATTDSYTATTKIVSIDGGLTNGVLIVGNTKANKIFGSAGSDTLTGGKGNDTLTGYDGEDIFIYDAGKDVITDYTSGEDIISLTAAAISESLNSKGDVVLKFSSANQLTIKGGDEIIFVTDGVETTKTYSNDRIVGADGVTLQSTFRGTTFAATEDLPKVDVSAVTKRFTLTGGDENNTLIGGKGTNFINGGAGDDILIGNGGSDTFVYSSGDDTISDYVSGTDKISLGSAMTNFNLEGDDVIIDFAEDSLTISDAAGEKITLIENGKSVVNIFAANGIFNSGKTAITLAADTSTFSAAGYSKLVSIDGGLVSSDASIVGNAKANKIFAGDAGSTINGGKGNDSLWGGNGDDTFIYESGGGKDVIYDFGDGDELQIAGTFTASVKNNSIAFKVGSQTNAITLKDYTATSFNINGDTYRISGNTLTQS